MQPKALILVVDDQPEAIELMRAYLEPEGYEIATAKSGADALNSITIKAIDLILLDVMLPDMDGFEVTRHIRSSEPIHRLPIILVTALSDTNDRVKGIEAGCDDFISKPIERIEMLAKVNSLLKIKAYNELKHHYQEQLEAEITSRTKELKQALENEKAASLETIYRLTVASEYKDEETGAHIKRMSLYSAAVARSIGLDEHTVETIKYAAPMHDIGKIGTPDRILLKPGKLDAEEWVIMKQHTVIGANILKGSKTELVKIGEMIARSHHEKWDGSGYPDGLKGDDIPVAARIVAIADVFDALSSARPYKKAFSLEQCFAIIEEGKGSHFDPAIVDAFFAVQDEILTIREKYTDTYTDI